MTRDEYWHDDYDRAAQAHHESRTRFKAADSARAVALADMNKAERELNRLFALRFNTPGVTVASQHRATGE